MKLLTKWGARDGFYTNPAIVRGGDGERPTMQTWWKGKYNLTFVGNFPISLLYAICKELLDFAIVQKISEKEKTSSHGYLSQHLLHNENESY